MLYSLIHGDQLLLGPIKYNYQLINYDLEELEIAQRLTSQSYTQVPIQFDDKTFLLPAREVYPEYDGKYYKILSSTWSITKENNIPTEVVFTYQTGERSLDEIKQQIKSLVPIERWNKENKIITLTINNVEVEVSTGREERSQFVSKLVSCSNIQNASHNYKFRNDVWVVIGCAEIEYILEQIDHVVQDAFDWELAKIDEIDACTTIDDVYNVQIV